MVAEDRRSLAHAGNSSRVDDGGAQEGFQREASQFPAMRGEDGTIMGEKLDLCNGVTVIM